jgi:hypothetical protein
MASHLFVKLPLAPTGIAKSDDPALGAAALGDRAQYIDRACH